MTLQGKPVDLTPWEFDLLMVLLRNIGRALSREQLLTKVWAYGLMATERSVDRCVKTLRAKLGSSHTDGLVAVRGIGFRWDGVVVGDE